MGLPLRVIPTRRLHILCIRGVPYLRAFGRPLVPEFGVPAAAQTAQCMSCAPTLHTQVGAMLAKMTTASRPTTPTTSPNSSRKILLTRTAMPQGKNVVLRAHGAVACAATTELLQPGTKIRVKESVTVSHYAKLGDCDLNGMEGEVVLDVSVHKGSPTSATLPLRCQFFVPHDGTDVKVIAHLDRNEVDIL